ncbi:beta-ketoacyl synthase N-terminal-like domain-containing protein [Streptomyces sp. NPDC005065]|uniref:beta-ketoacyl synthase N-terminal-like domain-containing protein n=1 Tax=unclassified Streptomyces TaxID=2593676 RepID=UPI0033A7FFF9
MWPEPIAIVGTGCVLPDALDPGTWWANLAHSRDSLRPVPAGRWRMPAAAGIGTTAESTDRTWSDMGGYVHGFDSVFDPDGFGIDATLIGALDPLFQWVMYSGRQALDEAGRTGPQPDAGLVLGNLSLPSASMAAYAEDVWLDTQPAAVRGVLLRPGMRPDPHNRFCSGLPAHLAATALGLGRGAFSLDAACASSLYAIKLACDRLHDRTADLMLAGGVNRADDLFLHIGFSALSAMSRTGQSRPFHRGADGLVPAEGAVLFALMRLSDAVATDTPILGVIRGVGLSNDGRSGGFLVPAREGQIRAMEKAYQVAGVAPETVSLVECHATGTPVGDAAEAYAMAKVFGAARDLPIGSAKSNVGHLITAAGGAGLLKVLGAMRAGVRPATLHADEPIEALRGTPLRLLTEPEEWPGPRRAAVSAFGFGGNNAHLIVEKWDGAVALGTPLVPASDPVAIVAVAVRAGDGDGTADFVASLLHGKPGQRRQDTLALAMSGLRFPPTDLRETHAQQLLLLDVVREATQGITLARERTIVLAGMGCDPEVARHGARWRIASLLADAGVAVDPAQLDEFRAAFAPPLVAAAVVGTMPNIVTNRLNAQLDLAGPSFTVSAEEASGTVALSLAARAIRAGEADAAIVAAVDLSDEPVHRQALAELGRHVKPGDAAVALVLKPLSAARRDADDIIALLGAPDTEDTALVVGAGGFEPAELFGSAHAADGLLAVATGALLLRHRAQPRPGYPADPALGIRAADVVVTPLAAPESRVRLCAGAAAGSIAAPPPRMHVYSGPDLHGVLAALAEDRKSGEGPARLVILAADAAQHARRATAARRWLVDGAPKPPGVAFRARPLSGEIGFVFTGGLAAYPRMGRELMMAFPALVDDLEPSPGWLRKHIGWAYTGADGQAHRALDQIWGTALLSQLHATITQKVLGLRPTATIGYSAGEANALVAMGVWTDLPELVTQINSSTLFTEDLAGDFAAVRRVWTRDGITGEPWTNHLVGASAARVRAALAGEPGVHLVAINAPDSCVIGGDSAGCERVLARLDGVNALHVPYRLAAHVPEVAEVRAEWRRLHHRATNPIPGVRLYSCATATSYTPTADAVADALTAQAVGTMDFAATIEQAWADGVRVFLEHGPQNLCTRWTTSTLGDRDHLAIALDPGDGRDVDQLMQVAAELVAANVEADTSALFEHLSACHPLRGRSGHHLTLPAHPPLVRLPAVVPADQVMPQAPPLASVMASIQTRHPARMPGVSTAARPNEARTAAAKQYLRIATAHQDFVILQAEVHQRYLDVNRQLLARARQGNGTAIVVPAQPPLSAAPRQVEPTHHHHRQSPAFDRVQLEWLASGRISELFGEAFAAQDGYERQTRMPQPPMLLVDRVTGIDAEPGSMGTGTIWTETDVRADSWYLDYTGRMPTGLLVEAGQADLLLISWLGVDLLNRGQRVYRLLGCDMSFHGSPPRPGETLRYEIHIDGHAEHDGVRLFFFHYDCFVGDELRLTMRNGQAGFFTDTELAATTGLLWKPDDDPPSADEKSEAPAAPAGHVRFDAAAVRAFAAGRPVDCFGPAWRATEAHVRTPRIADGRMLLLNEITAFDPAGGPWGRGYLRAETSVSASDWFFAGHFKNDPCMPGTLMLEGCLQAMAFYLAAAGCTIERDGWRFEPVPDITYAMRCRGQVTPDSHCLGYEVFVSGYSAGPNPTLYADVLCTVDGIKAFHARRVGLRLVPDWPLDHWRHLGPSATQERGQLVPPPTLGGLDGHTDHGIVAEREGFSYGYASLLACAWGRPTDAFGPAYAAFDGPRRMPRLPGPPYHFITRIAAVDQKPGSMLAGGTVEAEYDIPERAWYFPQNDSATMPLAVLMEIGLQPCGWLATYIGCPLSVDTDLLFRNLDGTAIVSGDVHAGAKTVRTRAHLRDISQTTDMILVFFDVECLADDVPVLTMSTSFGFFPPKAFAGQSGLPVLEGDHVALAAPGQHVVDLTDRPDGYRTGEPRLAGPMLLMLDRITGYWPDGGRAGLGRACAEKDVDAGEWFFKAHFFADPVQPGSLGIEAMYQLLQWCVIERGTRAANPRFAPMIDRPLEWKYRGQILPTNDRITIELEITEVGSDGRGEYVLAEAWLWVDQKRIYHARGLGIRILAGNSGATAVTGSADEELIDPATEPWLIDHCPTYTVPALPMAAMVDHLAQAAVAHDGRPVAGVRNIQVRRWLPLPGPVRTKYTVEGGGDQISVTLLAWREARTAAMSRFEPVVTGQVLLGDPPRHRPAMFEPIPDAVTVGDPYESGRLFQGPSLRYLESLRVGTTGASGVLDPAKGSAPRGQLHQGLLDGALQVVPSDRLWLWSRDIPHGVVGFPHRIVALDLFEPLPDAAEIRVEARFAGFGTDRSRVSTEIQMIADGQVCVAMQVVWALLPIGRIALAGPIDRRAFLRDRTAVPGLGLSAPDGGRTRLSRRDVEWCDWLAGTVAHVYGLPPGARGIDHLVEIAVRDHVAARAGVHPYEVHVAADGRTAHPASRPSETYRLSLDEDVDRVVVSDFTGESTALPPPTTVPSVVVR